MNDYDIPIEAHGTGAGYSYYKCKCEMCLDAWADYSRERRRKEKEREVCIVDITASDYTRAIREDRDLLDAMFYVVRELGKPKAKTRFMEFMRLGRNPEGAKKMRAGFKPEEYTVNINVRRILEGGGIDVLETVVRRFGSKSELENLRKVIYGLKD